MEMKECTVCGENKPLSDFHKRKDTKCGVVSKCKGCSKQYYQKNRSYLLARAEMHRERKETKRIASCVVCGSDFKTSINTQLCCSKECSVERRRITRRLYERKIKRYKMENDPIRHLRGVLAGRLRNAMNGVAKESSTVELLGCSIEQFRYKIEMMFSEGMTWNNYGPSGWHIDHIRPCSTYDLSDKEQQRQCFHWSNLQPLWAVDNMSKGDIYPTHLLAGA